MHVFIEKENREIELKKACTGIELLKELKINPNTVLLMKNEEIVLADEMLPEDAKVTILSVISGG
ncbi:MoaD/ThiS family protein [Candidatus Woesearchaeota archaeon]|nr:MoaD/ThiS family protein [Candidatus Woesearchaeota archaeon]